MKKHVLCIGHIVLAIVFVCWAVGCMGSSGIQTMIHKNSKDVVYLEWVPQESFRASHPVTLSAVTIRRLLQGVRVQTTPGLLKALLGEKAKFSRLFTDNDVESLVPHVFSAFSQVTSEEQVIFQTLDPSDASRVMIAGTLHVHEDLLFLTITHYSQKITYPTITVYKGNRQIEDPTGLKDLQVSFQPKTVWRKEASRLLADAEGQNDLNTTLVIDYVALAQLPDTSFPEPHEEPLIQPASDSTDTLVEEQKKGKELQNLKDRMRSLRDQLLNMEKKIEHLEDK